ncbi:Transcription initiation factor TFIID subunit 15b, partial [Bienertia sinuspersici]
GGPPSGGYGGGQRQSSGSYGGIASTSADLPAKVKQCDENCGDSCDNSNINVSNFPPDVTIDEFRELFGSIGTVRFVSFSYCYFQLSYFLCYISCSEF